MAKQGRNEKCACGSGKKYKYCCLPKDAASNDAEILGQLIHEAGMHGLEAARSERDEAERTLRTLIGDPRATDNDKLNASFSLVGIAQRRGDHQGALEQLEALAILPGSDPHIHATALKAKSLTQLGHCNEAADLFDDLLIEPSFVSNLARGWWELEAGQTYHLAGRIEDAIIQTERAAAFFEKRGEVEHLQRAKSNLAIFMLGSTDEKVVVQGEKLLEQLCDAKIAIGDWEGVSTNFSQLSLHHFERKRFERAIAYGRKDLKLSKFVCDERGVASTLTNMALIYVHTGQLSQARNCVQEAEEIGTRLNNPDIRAKCAGLSQKIEEFGSYAGRNKIAIGRNAICACGSEKKYIDCCGRADHEPVALRMPIGGVSEDIADIYASLRKSGLDPLQLDYAMRETEEARNRISWSEMREHDGWFEICELPDMANIHFNAAQALANQVEEHEDSLTEPVACAILAVSALEAFINSTIYFAHDAAKHRSILLPQELMADPSKYQRYTELTQKWDTLGAVLCLQWPPPTPIWMNFLRLVQIRNELVHYKAEGFVRVAPADKHPPDHLRNLPSGVVVRDVPSSWPIRLLTPSFAKWSVAVADELIRFFRSKYRFASPASNESPSKND